MQNCKMYWKYSSVDRSRDMTLISGALVTEVFCYPILTCPRAGNYIYDYAILKLTSNRIATTKNVMENEPLSALS
jgi:hypothetical protein